METNRTHCISISKHAEEWCICFGFFGVLKKKGYFFSFLRKKSRFKEKKKMSYNGGKERSFAKTAKYRTRSYKEAYDEKFSKGTMADQSEFSRCLLLAWLLLLR